MAVVNLRTLQSRLREHIRLAEAGETVLIVENGRVVAELRPSRPAEKNGGLHEASTPYYPLPREHQELSLQEQPESWEQRGVREGWLRLPTVRDGSPPPRAPVKGLTFEQLMADLERDREDR